MRVFIAGAITTGAVTARALFWRTSCVTFRSRVWNAEPVGKLPPMNEEERVAIREGSGRLTAMGLDKFGPGPASYDEARVCTDPDCSTVLSRYNPGRHCWQHESRRPFVLDRSRRRKRRNPGPTVIDPLEAEALARVPHQARAGDGNAA